jgi:hypothetical protein
MNRCIVPFTSFSEYEAGPGGKKVPVWFALGEDRPLACFAGIWTNWTSVRKAKEGEVTGDIFAFLATEANAEVAPIHPKAMPVIAGVRCLAERADAGGDETAKAAGEREVEDSGPRGAPGLDALALFDGGASGKRDSRRQLTCVEGPNVRYRPP